LSSRAHYEVHECGLASGNGHGRSVFTSCISHAASNPAWHLAWSRQGFHGGGACDTGPTPFLRGSHCVQEAPCSCLWAHCQTHLAVIPTSHSYSERHHRPLAMQGQSTIMRTLQSLLPTSSAANPTARGQTRPRSPWHPPCLLAGRRPATKWPMAVGVNTVVARSS